MDEDPNSQITFQTCLPSFNETTGLEAGYVFTINDGGGNGLCADGVCGSYSIMYGEEVVFESDGIYEAQQRVFLGSGLTNCPGNVETDDGVVSAVKPDRVCTLSIPFVLLSTFKYCIMQTPTFSAVILALLSPT